MSSTPPYTPPGGGAPPPYDPKVQWRAYREQLQPVLPTLAPWVERFGYPAE